jgi:antitoxin component YwqK of YwqJK toxin-antitoxin module
MKRIISLAVFCLPFMVFSQKAANQGIEKTESKTSAKADTIITKDPLNPLREFWVIHNLKGNVKAKGFMHNGKKDGVWREYSDANGVMSKITEYNDGVQNGASISFSGTGTIQSDETWLGDKKNGERVSFGSFGGRMKLLETFKDDQLDGVKKTFYDDGKIQEEGFYKKGQRDGLVKWYRQNGTPTMEYTYDNGNLEGPAKVYDDNGKLKQEGVYKNNNEEGEWKEYNDSLLVKKIIYKQGQILKEIPVKK